MTSFYFIQDNSLLEIHLDLSLTLPVLHPWEWSLLSNKDLSSQGEIYFQFSFHSWSIYCQYLLLGSEDLWWKLPEPDLFLSIMWIIPVSVFAPTLMSLQFLRAQATVLCDQKVYYNKRENKIKYIAYM